MATYTVKTGDNMTKIANQYGVALNDLIKANPQVKNPNLIYTGNVLNIPGASSAGTSSAAKTTGSAAASNTSATTPKAPTAATAGTANNANAGNKGTGINWNSVLSGAANIGSSVLSGLLGTGTGAAGSVGSTGAALAKAGAEAAVAGMVPYVSPYQLNSEALMQKILTQPEFKYDINTDALYQQYKQQYMNLGQQAMNDTIAQASTMTGGYGNSYASVAGQQAYQGYLNMLNDKIPELYQLKLNEYQMNQQNMYNQLGMLNDADAIAYQKYSDAYNRAINNRDYYANQYDNAYSRSYQASRDAVSDTQWQKEYDYRASRDAVDDYWQNKSYEYQVARDNVTDTQWQKQFDESVRQFNEQLGLKKSSLASSGGSSGSSKSSSGGSQSDYITEWIKQDQAKKVPTLKTYDAAVNYLESNKIDDGGNLMTESEWKRRKSASNNDSRTNGSRETEYNTYSDYLTNYVQARQNGYKVTYKGKSSK